MIEALITNGSYHSLDIGSLPGRARYGQDFVDTHDSHLCSEGIAKITSRSRSKYRGS
jgi:hypothetical protein